MSAAKFALEFTNQTLPFANYTSHFNSNASDTCMRHNNVILPPLDFSGTAYVAIGPISNFSSTFASCCPNKTVNAIQNYNGGNNRGNAPEYDAPLECFYLCSWNGSWRDVGQAVDCTKNKAEANGDFSRLILAATPDWPGESGGAKTGTKIGLLKWVVLGLMVGAATGL